MSLLCFWATEEVTGLVSLIRKVGITFKLCTEKTESCACFLCIREIELGDRWGRGSRNMFTGGKKMSLDSLCPWILCVSVLISNYISCLKSLYKSLCIYNYIFCLDYLSTWDRSLCIKLLFRTDMPYVSPGVEYSWLTVGYLDL